MKLSMRYGHGHSLILYSSLFLQRKFDLNLPISSTYLSLYFGTVGIVLQIVVAQTAQRHRTVFCYPRNAF